MSALKNNIDKVIFGVVLLLAIAFIAMESMQSEPESFKSLSDNLSKISSKLESGTVSPQYAFSPDAAAKIAEIGQQVDENLARGNTDLPALRQNVVYQRPLRPAVDPTTRPLEENEKTKIFTAKLSELTDVDARGDIGRVFVTYKLPQDMVLMDVIRVEIFRGMAMDQIDTTAPYAVVEHNPEIEVKLDDVPATEPAETTPSDNDSRRRRRDRDGAEPAEAPREEKKLDIPPEYANFRVYADSNVEPKRTYYYQLRMVGRMKYEPNHREETKDANGNVTAIQVYQAPADGTNIAAKQGSSKRFFATPMTKVVSATPPSNFEIRLSGTSGVVSPPDTPVHRISTAYKGNFNVRVWVQEASDWKDITIQAGPNERLKGTLSYRSIDTNEQKEHVFDTLYTLEEIRQELVPQIITEQVLDLDAQGNPKKDANGKPIYIEKQRKGTDRLVEIAILKDAKGVVEKIEKRGDFEKREKSIEYFKRMAKEQEAIRLAEEKRRKDYLAKMKAQNKPAQPHGQAHPEHSTPPQDMMDQMRQAEEQHRQQMQQNNQGN